MELNAVNVQVSTVKYSERRVMDPVIFVGSSAMFLLSIVISPLIYNVVCLAVGVLKFLIVVLGRPYPHRFQL